jgi:serine phosphatase RsbU (regulator of sigma subunit)
VPAEDNARLGAALRELLRRGYGMLPEDLPRSIRELAVEHLGARDVVLYLVDLDQTELRPFDPDRTDLAAEPVDSSLPGRAFQEERLVVQHGDDGRRVWIPVLDSAERLGVLAVHDDGDVDLKTWAQFTSLVGELVMGKQQFGDAIASLRRTGELTVAAEMRWSLLPPLTFTSPKVGVSGILQPSRLIAGDAFDYAVTGGCAHVALFDAMGHGLEASRMANLAIGTYRNARRAGRDLTDILAAMDAILDAEFGDARFVTAQVAQLDLERGELHVASAGHPSPILLPAAGGNPQTIECPPARPAGLGYRPDGEIVVQLSEGDAVLFHTDGVSEARSPSMEVYGEARMAQAVWDRLKLGHRPAEVLRRTIHDALAWQGERVRDDASLVLLSWCPEAVTAPGEADPINVT